MRCLSPKLIEIHPKVGEPFFMDVGCGYCVFCLKRKSFNLYLKLLSHYQATGKVAYFITMTYRNGIGTRWCSKRHCQLFIKRMRKYGLKFDYYVLGEYGDVNMRPHYHMVYFGELPDIEIWSNGDIPHFRSKVVSRLWRYGICDVELVHDFNVKYIAKHQFGKLFSFRLFSKSLGRSYFSSQFENVIQCQEVIVGCNQYPIFDYVKNKLRRDQPELWSVVRDVVRSRMLYKVESLDSLKIQAKIIEERNLAWLRKRNFKKLEFF